MPALRALARALTVLSLCGATAVSAQTLPAGPARAFDGRLVAGGEISATVGADDDTAFFNYTDYERNTFRMLRVALSAAWRPVDRIALVGEVRSEDFEHARASAAYIRVRPWREREFDVQAGRVPPVFGAFSRQAYSSANPLIGFPLAYQYLTSLHPGAVPASADDLLRMRGRGWRSSFPVGDPYEGPGVPLVSAFRWDVGVQARWAHGPVELAGSITNGTLSNPLVSDDNDGKQVSVRLAARPLVGLVVGASAARGAWLSRDLARSLSERTYAQRAFGADAEYSRDHWLVRGELVWTAWDLPFITAGSVSARGSWIEGRYRLSPRFYVAARADRLDFSRIIGQAVAPGIPTPWDAPVRRLEAAAGWYLQRNLIARLGVQRNARDGGRVHERTFVAGQLTYWF
jgi:hypothetical protein